MIEQHKGSFLGLVPLLIFVSLYLSVGIVLQMQNVKMAFYQFQAPIASFIAIIIAFLIFKGSITEKFESFLKGCGHQDVITMCMIYLLAGAFATVSKAMGGVDATVNMGLTYIPAQYIALGLFVVSSFISTSTGTSVGAIVSITPIAAGLAEKSGVSLPLILAAVMGGAMFGDNLSVISDTTIAATKTQCVEMKDKFRVNLFIATPAAIITLILLFIFGKPDVIPEIEILNFSFIKIVPYLTVLILAIIGVNVFVVLTSGILLSGIVGLKYGTFTLLTLSNTIYSGFTSMNEIFLLSLLTGGLAAMTTKAGGLQWLIDKIQKIIIGKKTAKLGIGFLVALTDMAVANNTVAIIISGPIAKKISEKYNVNLKDSAAILDIFSCVFQGLIPYGAQMLILLEYTNGVVSPFDLIPLLWYQFLLLAFTIITIYFPFHEKFLKY